MLAEGGYFWPRPNVMLLVKFVVLSVSDFLLKIEVVGTGFFLSNLSGLCVFLHHENITYPLSHSGPATI